MNDGLLKFPGVGDAAGRHRQVDDDGRGFDETTIHRGDGLTNLEYRAEAVGGSVTIRGMPDEGTTVRLVVPL